MLVATHQMGIACNISDRVCFFHVGKIEEGPAAQLSGRPQREWTQRLLSAGKEVA